MTARGVLNVPWREWIASDDLASIESKAASFREKGPAWRQIRNAYDPGTATRLVLAILNVHPQTSHQLKKAFAKNKRSSRGVGGTLGRMRVSGLVQPIGHRWELTEQGRKEAEMALRGMALNSKGILTDVWGNP